MEINSQIGAIINHLKEHGDITSKEAFNLYGCTRLAARIYDLRSMGYIISTTDEVCKTRYGTSCRYARYVLSRKQRYHK